jgi:hypothetical protein
MSSNLKGSHQNSMKNILRVAATAGGAVLLALLVSFLLPSYYVLESSAEIAAPPSVVFGKISDFQQWKNWNPWDHQGKAPETSTPSFGIDAWHGWKNSPNGDVRATITYLEENQSLYYRMMFDTRNIVAIGSFKLTVDRDKTRISWRNAYKLGINPLKRWVGLFYWLHTGPQLDDGLAKLKQLCEVQKS